MRDGSCKKTKLSWPKSLVKKWFNIKSKAEDFQADDIVYGGVDNEWRNNFLERQASTNKKKSKTENKLIDKSGRRNADRFHRNKIDLDTSEVTDVDNYRIFVATWNVAGKSPPNNLNLDDWLHTSPPADIYVLGFQEIVPLNAGNVLGTEDNGPGRKWLALIRKTLNSLPGTSGGGYRTPSPVPNPVVELDADFEGSAREQASSFFHRRSFQTLSHSMRVMENEMSMPRAQLDRRFSVCDRGVFGGRPSDYDPYAQWGGSSDDENGPDDSPITTHCSPISYSGSISLEDRDRQPLQSRYCLVASKQMVGIFLTIWIRSELRDDVRNLKVSCVGRGLMGYLGNKGSISVSMSLHQTSFCFICSHLTSGQKEGDELRRNSDVLEILKKTRFPRVHGFGDDNSPQTILEHDRIIWLGDLNYRIALSYRTAKALVEMRNWRVLLDNDQLRIEQRMGRVFNGWSEGRVYFPPTYKYSSNSDRYAGEDTHPKEKRRTPAWCDRILWYGRGLHQISYVRGESRFSDHRPVYSIFLAEVESINRHRIKKSLSYASSRVEVEELLPHSYGYGGYYY
ncbi:type I inositol polyphosphate 5-phosphatase 4 [Nicotiana tabacum]|uniref:Type I inositol polyphosphate 5-phosphatase 4 isoform X1 n=2 Tax=Nicotiana tabacum TaxID=4097 RepID=A0A1S4BTY3_TOBAC|nr:type I inositol polyphosphate 5-phosphatase 4 isoform X1 [Nicotiana tomentosiformis]XP_009607686.1 type I inositol polyphosphate 5-phosphatase 4 isoform X1 [Nicotiana tomentosiformis]XP_009607695.1 type I inositol polyphosphate 5-phosphatase 4 isoform X1 [Nicotiana tomentosiformis]XP_009607702.1 type I inositol polyphosphate 5-phosphatase 4 isoform X1 [Nicotiana tomentosiformis]XP_016492210.1 PREDICTED: type I inositol polyphosphate 5-phosphatase 4-like isoform X1 [Nicotiana tabacum]XP_0164